MIKLAKISKNTASLAITTLKVPSKPAMVTIENLNKDSEIIEIEKVIFFKIIKLSHLKH